MRLGYLVAPSLAIITFLACSDPPKKRSDDDDDATGVGGTSSVGGSSGVGGNPVTTTTSSVGGQPSTTSTSTGSGTSCQDAVDCGAPDALVCDPDTQTCISPECDAEAQNCPSGQFCLYQGSVPSTGACYTSCDANQPSSCGTGKTCLDLAGDEQVPICFNAGSAQKGQSCESGDTFSDCATGLRCLYDENMMGNCYDTCDFWGGTGACPASGEYCEQRGFCLPQSAFGAIDPAAVGAACAGAQMGCGLVGDKVTGVCADPGGGTIECLKWCRLALGESGNPDCPGQSCYEVGLSTFGICY